MIAPSLRLDPARASAAIPRRYALADLGLSPDASPFLPFALNATGDLAAAAARQQPPGLIRGYGLFGQLRTPAGLAFGHPPVSAVSNSGLFAGAAGTGPAALRAWASHLGTFGDRFWPERVSVARGVNTRGDLTGNVLFEAGDVSLSRAFFLPLDGLPRLLAPPLGGTTTATALNDAGDLAFNSAPLGSAPGQTQAWCYRSGSDTYLPLDALGGVRAWAHTLSPGGLIAGHALAADRRTHACLWRNGRIEDLGAPPEAHAEALGVNDDLVVVGRIRHPGSGRRAFRWTPAHGLQPLDACTDVPPGWELQEAVSINRHGVIVGQGRLHGQPRGFRLTPLDRTYPASAG